MNIRKMRAEDYTGLLSMMEQRIILEKPLL